MTRKFSHRLLQVLNHVGKFAFEGAYLHVSHSARLRLLLHHLFGDLSTYLSYLGAEVLGLFPHGLAQLKLIFLSAFLSPYLFQLVADLFNLNCQITLILLDNSLYIVLVLAQFIESLLLGKPQIFLLGLQGKYFYLERLRLVVHKSGQVCVQGLLQLY